MLRCALSSFFRHSSLLLRERIYASSQRVEMSRDFFPKLRGALASKGVQ
jgi:hypothetical protein